MDTEIKTQTGLKTGTVFKKTIGRYWVRTGDATVVCTISSKLRKVLIYPEADASSRRQSVDKVADIEMVDPVAVGDEVRFRDSGDESGMIIEVLPRRTKLSRRAVLHGADKPQEKNITREQLIVTNVDQMIAVVSARRPKPSWRLVDRYLADSELLEIPIVICLTKMDLIDDVEMFCEQLQVYADIGYKLLFTSAVTGLGMDELTEILSNRTSVLMGKSGVGKTTLLNTLEPGLGLRVQEVSTRVNKGRHTTTHLEMFPLRCGGFVVDTPGMREFAPWLDKTDVNPAWLFREMRPYIGQCKFGMGCTHSHEPGCTIKAAVDAGKITERRYDSYLRILRS
ncbi:ribosome small subunit-dependent GTPase A [candidate division TA06 bacterium B3_TA06]|uniref:Small ribosomal subunit biogenesis GTPase RsgA n=1 Tax=candidate division TA06 bacterium B3_TA06 TaxID=2012487 RepID=A0A532V668_UNCT6|nr:MAG: ribosome small subunit-dependent GTPase A [candidate division TA06 bacterium B3_TA06]